MLLFLRLCIEYFKPSKDYEDKQHTVKFIWLGVLRFGSKVVIVINTIIQRL